MFKKIGSQTMDMEEDTITIEELVEKEVYYMEGYSLGPRPLNTERGGRSSRRGGLGSRLGGILLFRP